MFGTRIAGSVFTAILLSIGSTAVAGIPDPSMSTIGGDLMLGNARGFAIIPTANVRPSIPGGYRVVLRDAVGNPLNGVTVTMHFAGTGIRPHASQSSGQVADCVAGTISLVTNVGGEAIFYPATTGLYTSTTPDVQVRAGSVLLTRIRFRSIDLNPGLPSSPSGVDIFDVVELWARLFERNGERRTDPETDFATEGASAGITDGFDVNVLRFELLCGVLGAPIPHPCSQVQCP